MAKAVKQAARVVEMSYAKESSQIGVLDQELPVPGTSEWHKIGVNTVTDFGGAITTTARVVLDPSRQREKGRTTDKDAAGTVQVDLTADNLQDLIAGYLFTTIREKGKFGKAPLPIAGVDGTAEQYQMTAAVVSVAIAVAGTGYAVDDIVTISGGTFGSAATARVTAETAGVPDAVVLETGGDYTVEASSPAATTGGTGTGLTLNLSWDTEAKIKVGSLLFASNFAELVNNGLKRVTAVTPTLVTVAENLVDEVSPPATARLEVVGFEFAAGDLDVDASGSLPAYTSTVKDMTELGLVPGEFFFVGGDLVAQRFTNTDVDGNFVNNKWKRARSISANLLTVDKSDFPMSTEASVSETIRIFFGRVIRNESDPTLIVRSTYNWQRTLGAPETTQPNNIQSEYIIGAVPGELTQNIPLSGKVSCDMAFTAINSETRTGVQGPKSDDANAVVFDRLLQEFFNTGSDFVRKKIARVVAGEEAPEPLFAFVDELSWIINNTLSPDKAIGSESAFDVTEGTLNVSGQINAYFNDVAAVESVNNNDPVTIDVAVVNRNTGFSVDMPLLTLGDGRPVAELDQSVKIPVSQDAARGRSIDPGLDYTIQYVFFPYLPNLASLAS